ncbi:MAG TPA: TOBE domain-containing protein [Phototrophicaceae bacterium]|nr:TOBE domain-containing protein [Phototrophicaceae bacterium]
MALRPEKINLFPVKGVVEYEEGSQETTEEYMKSLTRVPNMNLIRGRVQHDVYIGTDTRYVIRIPGEQEVVARVQNFGLRSDTFFEDGQEVNMYWNAENARVLLQ